MIDAFESSSNYTWILFSYQLSENGLSNFLLLQQAEKTELREEKLMLKADKEKMEQQLKTLALPTSGFMPTYPAAYHAAANKIPVFPGYGLMPMWHYLPPTACDTSRDHELRPPAAWFFFIRQNPDNFQMLFSRIFLKCKYNLLCTLADFDNSIIGKFSAGDCLVGS